jgi:hypothetical protein
VTDVDRSIASLRVVTTGMLGSVVASAAVAVAFRQTLERPLAVALEGAIVPGVGAVAVASAALYAFVRRNVKAAVRRRSTELRSGGDRAAVLLRPYQQLALVRASLVDAPALLAAVGYLAGGPPWLLAVSAVAALVLVTNMPSRADFERFAEELLGPA